MKIFLSMIIGGIVLINQGEAAASETESLKENKYETAIVAGSTNPVKIQAVKSEQSSTCLFCKIPRQETQVAIIATFKHCYAIKDAYPVSNGHTVIIPYEHTENWFTASDEVRLDIMEALLKIKAILDAEYNPDGYNIGVNCGKIAGQSIMHLHVHLIPRYKGDMDDPKGGVRGVIPSKQKY